MKEINVDITEGVVYADITHAYVWDKSDYEKIREIYSLIQQNDKKSTLNIKREIIKNFEGELERYRNDQTSRVEPLEVIEKEDRVTNSGRTRAAELISGEAGERFDFAALGTSQFPVSDSDYQLYAEIAGSRINIKLSGYASASGAIIKHSGLWTPGLESATIWEFAPVDLPTYNVLQMIWARVVFPPNKPLIHVANEDFVTVTHSTYTQSLV